MLRRVITGALAVAATVVFYAGWRWVRPGREPAPPDPAGAHAEHVYFSSLDGTRLHGLYLPGRDDYPTVLLCHGYAKSLAEPWDIGLRLNRAGYNTFFLEFRACGQSGGRYTTMGYKETWDLLAAVRYIKVAYGRKPIGVLSISMGAAVAIMAAARSPELAAVVADSPYADLQGVLRHKVSDFVILPWLVPLGWLSIRLGQRLAGFQAAQVRPIDYVQDIAPRPLLLIYGQRDRFIPAEQAQQLFRRAGEPKEIWLAPDSDHAVARLDHPEEYLRRVLAFLDGYLLERQAAASSP